MEIREGRQENGGGREEKEGKGDKGRERRAYGVSLPAVVCLHTHSQC